MSILVTKGFANNSVISEGLITHQNFVDSRISRRTQRGSVNQDFQWEQTGFFKAASATGSESYCHHKDPEPNWWVTAIQILFLSALSKKTSRNSFVKQRFLLWCKPFQIWEYNDREFQWEGGGKCSSQQQPNLTELVGEATFHESAFPRIPLENVKTPAGLKLDFLGSERNVKFSSYSGIDASKQRVHLSMMLSP